MDLEETRKKFAEFAKKNKKKKFVISTHAKADVDAISLHLQSLLFFLIQL